MLIKITAPVTYTRFFKTAHRIIDMVKTASVTPTIRESQYYSLDKGAETSDRHLFCCVSLSSLPLQPQDVH